MQVHMEIFTKDALAPSFLMDMSDTGDATISDLKKYVAASITLKSMNIQEKHFVFILTSFNVWGEGECEAQQVVHDTWPLADLIPHGKHRLVPYELAVGLEDTFGFFFKVFCVGIQDPGHPVQRSRRMEFLASLNKTPCPKGVKRTYSEASMYSVASSQEDGQAAKPGESGSTQAASSSASGPAIPGSTQAASSTGSGPTVPGSGLMLPGFGIDGFDTDGWGDAHSWVDAESGLPPTEPGSASGS